MTLIINKLIEIVTYCYFKCYYQIYQMFFFLQAMTPKGRGKIIIEVFF